MIPTIIVTSLAFMFGVVVLWAGLLAIGFGGALVILAWKSVKFTVFGTWRLACFILWAARKIVVGAFRVARFTILAAIHVGGDLARPAR